MQPFAIIKKKGKGEHVWGCGDDNNLGIVEHGDHDVGDGHVSHRPIES